MLDDLTHKLTSLRHNVVPEWGPGRSDRTYREIARIRMRRRMRNVSVAGALAVIGLALGATQLGSTHVPIATEVPERAAVLVPFEVHGPEPRAEEVEAQPAELAVTESDVLPSGRLGRLADGSTAEVTSVEGSLAVDINQPDHVSLRLAAGCAHFDVVPNAERRFSVFADGVEVVVVGTAFDVERTGNRVRVAVSHGTVRVRSARGTSVVQGGEARWFELPKRKNAGRGPESLMEAADAARLSNQPEAAASYLREVLTRHRKNPAAPLAAFTLGRVLLERLGRPAEAADAFATARQLAPRGSLAQDALAREVESWSKAGHATEAYDRSRLFMERYPSSRRLRVVQLYGGIETSQ